MNKLRKYISRYLLSPSNDNFQKLSKICLNDQLNKDKNIMEVIEYLIPRKDVDIIRYHLSYFLFFINKYNESYFYLESIIEKKYVQSFYLAHKLSCMMYKLHDSSYILDEIGKSFGKESEIYIFEYLRHSLNFYNDLNFDLYYKKSKYLVKSDENFRILIFSCIRYNKPEYLVDTIFRYRFSIKNVQLNSYEHSAIKKEIMKYFCYLPRFLIKPLLI